MTRRLIQFSMAAGVAALMLGAPAQAAAQNGTLTGRVIDADRRTTDRDGKPLAGKPKDPTGQSKDPRDRDLGLTEAIVTLELKGDQPRKFEALTDGYGEWYKSGLPPGTYDISVRREWRDPVQGRTTKLVVFTASASGIVLAPGAKVRVPDMAGLTDEARAAGRRPASTGDVAAVARQNADFQELFEASNKAVAAGNWAEAVVKLTELAEKTEKCTACYIKIGEYQLKAKNEKGAEEAFLKAMEMDPNNPDPPNQLASLYNEMRRFEDALKMGARYNELTGGGAAAGTAGAAGRGGGGGGDATSLFRQGAIYWNAGKFPEARAEFEKAVKANPNLAQAQYYLAMTIVNLASADPPAARMTDAKAPFEAYLKLEPKGEFVETVKAILSTIK